MTNNQNLIQSLKEDLNKVKTEKETIQKDLDAKIIDIQEKVKTITQVKKIGRRYKTQYEELKAQQDKVFQRVLSVVAWHTDSRLSTTRLP